MNGNSGEHRPWAKMRPISFRFSFGGIVFMKAKELVVMVTAFRSSVIHIMFTVVQRWSKRMKLTT